jgi:hypothetical protein
MNWVLGLYKTNNTFRGLVQAGEGGALTGFLTATAAGFNFSKSGWGVLAAAVGGGAATAVRNYLSNRPNQPPTVAGEVR